MKSYLSLFTVMLCAIFTLQTRAQTVLTPLDFIALIEPVETLIIPQEVADTLDDPMSLLSPADEVNIHIYFTLQDTGDISKIHLKTGRTNGANDVLENTFNYDDYSPGSGLTYQRNGNMIILGIGNHSNAATLYAEVYLEDSSGNTSNTVTYTSVQP